jgi:hypothetical protein
MRWERGLCEGVVVLQWVLLVIAVLARLITRYREWREWRAVQKGHTVISTRRRFREIGVK